MEGKQASTRLQIGYTCRLADRACIQAKCAQASKSWRTAQSRERMCARHDRRPREGVGSWRRVSVAQRKINEFTRKRLLLVQWPAPRAAMDYGEGRRGDSESRTLVSLLFALAPWVSDKI